MKKFITEFLMEMKKGEEVPEGFVFFTLIFFMACLTSMAIGFGIAYVIFA